MLAWASGVAYYTDKLYPEVQDFYIILGIAKQKS